MFTQTVFGNRKVHQAIYENKVRDALKRGYKVVFQVKPIVHGCDLMAKGVQMQKVSTNRKLNFNVYIYNVQPGVNLTTRTDVLHRQPHESTYTANVLQFHDNGIKTTIALDNQVSSIACTAIIISFRII